MTRKLHPCARTNATLRREIQESSETNKALAARLGLKLKTVAKWRSRTTTSDARKGPSRENSFAVPVIRIQDERQQRVIGTGPYAIVRHPMYAGASVYMIGMPLLLGSWLGLLVLPLILSALTLRIFIEEAALCKGLPGYDEYAHRVRYRLIPGVW